MHERKVMEDLVREIERRAAQAGGHRVTRIRVRLGALSHFTPEHFREHFEDASRGTLAGKARIESELGTDPTEPTAQGVGLEELDVEY